MRRPWAGLRGPSTPLPQQPRTESKGAIDRRHSAGPTYQFAGSPYVAPVGSSDLDRVVRDQYERDLWVWRAVDARAKNAAKLDVQVKTGRGKGATVIEEHPLARVLNRKANMHETAQAFRYRLHALLDLSVTKGVFVEVIENNASDVASMHLLNPLHTWPVPDPDTFVSHFEMRLPSGETFDELPPYRRGQGGVLWIKRPHPTDPYRSTSWLEAAALTIELDYFALRYSRNFLMNDGRPGGVLMVKSEDGIEPADAAVLQGRMSGGPENAGRVTIMEAEALEYLDLSKTARDAQYVEARQMTQREILVAAGTPLSVIGDASGQTFENSDADERLFWRNEMVPEVELVGSYWEELTEGGITDDTEVVTYDWTKVAVLQREMIAVEQRAQAEFDKGLITVDEYRELTGKEPLELPGTRVLWTTSGRAPIGSEADVTALLTQGMQQPAVDAPAATSAAQLEGGPQPSLPVGSGLPDDDDDVIEGELVDPTQRQIKALATLPDSYLAQRRKAHDELLTRWETAVVDVLTAVGKRQEEVVLARLTGAKARKHTRHWHYEGGYRGGELKALDAGYVVERRRWIEELVDALAELIMAAFRAAGLATLQQLGNPRPFEPPPTAGETVARAVRQIAEAFDARGERLQDLITTRDLAGEPIGAIADAVREAYRSGPTWAEVAAQPVIGTVNAASLASARQSGALAKRWLATDDERTRKTHRKAEGQVVALEDPFLVGKALLMYPHDPSGPIGETIYCRCTMLYQLGALEDDDDEVQWKGLPVPAGPRFDLDAYALDAAGRFLDTPAVLTLDGKSGVAVAVDQGSVTVRRADGRVLCVSADDLTPGHPDGDADVATVPVMHLPGEHDQATHGRRSVMGVMGGGGGGKHLPGRHDQGDHANGIAGVDVPRPRRKPKVKPQSGYPRAVDESLVGSVSGTSLNNVTGEQDVVERIAHVQDGIAWTEHAMDSHTTTPWQREVVSAAAREVLDAHPELDGIRIDSEARGKSGSMASARGWRGFVIDAVNMTPEGLESYRDEWKGMSIASPGKAGRPSEVDVAAVARGIVVHEFGHVLNHRLERASKEAKAAVDALVNEPVTWRDLGFTVGGTGVDLDTPVERWKADTLDVDGERGRSIYATENAREWFAEAYADGFLNGDQASDSGKRALALVTRYFGGDE